MLITAVLEAALRVFFDFREGGMLLSVVEITLYRVLRCTRMGLYKDSDDDIKVYLIGCPHKQRCYI